MVNSEELLGTTEYLTLYTRFRINRCRYSRVRLYFLPLTLQYHLGCYYFILKSSIKIVHCLFFVALMFFTLL
jgi:hypothetical protein